MRKSKSKAINNLGELWQNFTQLYGEEDFSRILWRPAPNQPEIRLEIRNDKTLLEVEPHLHPSRRLLENRDTADRRLLLCPALSEPLARDLRTLGINHADLNGRLYLSLEQPTLLIDRRPTGRAFANPVSELDVFAPKSTRLARALLTDRDRLWTQADLTTRCDLSRGLVSRLVRALVAENHLRPVTPASRREAGTWKLVDFDRLLDAWQERDASAPVGTVREYSVLGEDPVRTAHKLQGWLGASAAVFTEWFGANQRRPYTDTPVVSAYVRDNAALDLIPARTVVAGGNLRLIVPPEDGPLRETREVDGFRLACDVQLYLDLRRVGGRGLDHAQELRRWSEFAR